jgi:methionyl-tRNA formyltransferase
MRISILCSDASHPVNSSLEAWAARHAERHDVQLLRRKAELPGGDILFLLSCTEILREDERAAYGVCLVLHASDLPQGRGWSPHVWDILDGAEVITVTLLEAQNPADTGRIWSKKRVPVPRHALWDEINQLLFGAELQLMDMALQAFGRISSHPQPSEPAATYCRRRTPEDSRLDPGASLVSQFNLLRVCDPHRFPAFFELHGHRYKVVVEKMKEITPGLPSARGT